MSNKVEATFHPHPSYVAMEAAWDPAHRYQPTSKEHQVSSLTGTSTAANRAELEKRAHAIAAQFYGTECVTVTLSDASVESIQSSSLATPHEPITTGFTADWEAVEWHRYEHPAYGYPKCTGCGRLDTR